jgi:HD-like signal output (HDOD) protein
VNPVTYEILTQRIKRLGNLPAMPVILAALCEELSRKTSQIDVERVVNQISYDKSLAAQCLRLANSALFRQRGDVSTIREAVFALGLWRIRDLAFSCNLPLLFNNIPNSVPKEVFWRHALAVALVSQKLGRQFNKGSQDQVYLAGLLHDIGILVSGILFPDNFGEVLREAAENKACLEDVEKRIMGFTHAESGRILAELWRLPFEVSEAIEYHFRPEAQKTENELSVLVHVADLVCLKNGLGYGYDLSSEYAKSMEDIWCLFAEHFPKAARYSSRDFEKLLTDHVHEAGTLAEHVFQSSSVHP